MKKSKDFNAKIKVKALVTDKVSKTQKKYSYKDIGKIVETEMNYDLMVGSSKRDYPIDIKKAKDLLKGLYYSPPFHYFEDYMPGVKRVDGTLNSLPNKRNAKKHQKTGVYNKRKEEKKKKREFIYNQLVNNGVDPGLARKARDSYKKAEDLFDGFKRPNA